MKNVILNIDGERVQVWTQTLGNEVWFHFNGKTYQKEILSRSKRRGKSTSESNKNSIVSPMPGKILSVKVSEGQSLKKGDLIVVMEAMKMEYSLKAPAECKVKSIKCSEGEQVNLKQLLIELDFQGDENA